MWVHAMVVCRSRMAPPVMIKHNQRLRPTPTFLAVASMLSAFLSSYSAAQDIRGLEVCTAEKQVERRTSCLQSNVEFLQQGIAKLARETQEKITAANRELASAKAEIAALKSKLELLSSELAKMRAAGEPKGKK